MFVDVEEVVVGTLVALIPVATLDADISRRSPGRKVGHDFWFNCRMLSFKKKIFETI